MELKELKEELAKGYQECLKASRGSNLTDDSRNYYGGKADGLLVALGQINKILNEKVNA